MNVPALRAVVVDDEHLARQRLTGFLGKLDDVEIVGQASNGVEALQIIEETSPDLVFLDVQMPGMDGFEVLKALRDPPQVVFATAYDEYALRAFEVEAVDYLLKPFARQRVEDAVNRVRTRMAAGAAAPDLDAMLKKLEANRRVFMPQVPVHSGKKILIVPTDEILWFGVEYRLVYAHTAERPHMTNYTLRELEERLDPDQFFRAHKSTLVNMRQVKEIVPWFGGRFKFVMRDPAASEVQVSRAQARLLRTQLKW
jgi:two-component system, LytTR family, response regulator LytT